MPFDKLKNLFTLRATSDELLHLDMVRIVASAGIVLCHSGEFFFSRADRLDSHARMAGLALFVDVFFIISGFVIAHVYADRIGTWRDYGRFMQRRVGRLYPLHIVTMLAMAGLFAVIGSLNVATNTDMRLVPQCLVTGALLIHSAVDCGGRVPNGVNWSISAEMFMYLAFPVLLWVSARLGWLRYLAWAGFMFIAFRANAPGADWAQSNLPWRALPGFFLGIALRHDWRFLARIPLPSVTPLMLSLALAVGSLVKVPINLLLVLAYLIAISGVIADGRAKAAPVVARLAPWGQLTYSMYMLHPFVVMILINAIGDKLLKLGVPALSAVTLAGYVLIVIVSILSFKLFETPARRWIDRQPIFDPAPKPAN